MHHYITYLDETKRSIPVGELFEEFLSVKQQDNVSRKYLADLRSKLGFRHYRRPMNEASASAYFDLRLAIPPCPTSNDAPSDATDESFQKKLTQRRQRNTPGTL